MAAIVSAIIVATARELGGASLRRTRRGWRRGGRCIFVLYVVLPPVTFFNLARVQFDADIGLGDRARATWPWRSPALLAWFVAARLLRLRRPAVGSVICCTLVANTGYLGYPLVAGLLGFDRAVGGRDLRRPGFRAGAAGGRVLRSAPRSASGRARPRGERVAAFFVRNPPLYAAALALVAPDALAPDVLVDASRIAIVALLPLGFFAVGAALAEEADEGTSPVPPPLDAAVAAAVAAEAGGRARRCSPDALPLIDLPGPYLLLAAMPCGINTMIVTHAYGVDLRSGRGHGGLVPAIAIASPSARWRR